MIKIKMAIVPSLVTPQPNYRIVPFVPSSGPSSGVPTYDSRYMSIAGYNNNATIDNRFSVNFSINTSVTLTVLATPPDIITTSNYVIKSLQANSPAGKVNLRTYNCKPGFYPENPFMVLTGYSISSTVTDGYIPVLLVLNKPLIDYTNPSPIQYINILTTADTNASNLNKFNIGFNGFPPGITYDDNLKRICVNKNSVRNLNTVGGEYSATINYGVKNYYFQDIDYILNRKTAEPTPILDPCSSKLFIRNNVDTITQLSINYGGNSRAYIEFPNNNSLVANPSFFNSVYSGYSDAKIPITPRSTNLPGYYPNILYRLRGVERGVSDPVTNRYMNYLKFATPDINVGVGPANLVILPPSSPGFSQVTINFIFPFTGFSYNQSTGTLTVPRDDLISGIPITLNYTASNSDSAGCSGTLKLNVVGGGATEPTPGTGGVLLAVDQFIYGVVGDYTVLNVPINYNGNNTVDAIVDPPFTANTISTGISGNPSPSVIITSGDNPGFYPNINYTLDGDISAPDSTVRRYDFLHLLTGTVNLSGVGATQDIIILPPGSPGIVDLTGLTFDPITGLSYNHATKTLTFTKSNFTAGVIIFDYTASFFGNSNAEGKLPITFEGIYAPVSEPTPLNLSTDAFIGGVVGITTESSLAILYNGNNTVDMEFPNPLPGGVTLTPVQGINPISIAITSTSNATAFYNDQKYTLRGDIFTSPLTQRNLDILILRSGIIDLSAPGKTQDHVIMDSGSFGINDISSMTFTHPGVAYDHGTKTLTFSKKYFTAGEQVFDYSASVPGNPNGSGTLPMTFIGTYIAPPEFVGGTYSIDVCINYRGASVNNIIAGETTSRLYLVNQLINIIGDIIRKTINIDYQNPIIQENMLDTLFNDESNVITFDEGLTNLINLMTQGVTNINHEKSIVKIVKSYFKPMRIFILKFYNNNSLINNTCIDADKKSGFNISGKDCTSCIKFNMNLN